MSFEDECLGEDGIYKLDFSARIFNALCNEGIFTVSRLEKCTEDDLLKLKNIGKTSVEEIKTKLESINKKLSTYDDESDEMFMRMINLGSRKTLNNKLHQEEDNERNSHESWIHPIID